MSSSSSSNMPASSEDVRVAYSQYASSLMQIKSVWRVAYLPDRLLVFMEDQSALREVPDEVIVTRRDGVRVAVPVQVFIQQKPRLL